MSGAGPVVVGVLLAAGRSRRMGRAKQLLPWPAESSSLTPGMNETTIVAASYDRLAANSDAMIVVLGHEADRVAHALAERAYERVVGDGAAEMFDSIKRGLVAAQSMNAEVILLHPADQVLVSPGTIQEVVGRAREMPGGAVAPVFEGRGGHPVAIPRGLVDRILAYGDGDGLGGFWRRNPSLLERIEVEDEGAVLDIDDPEAYEAAIRRLGADCG